MKDRVITSDAMMLLKFSFLSYLLLKSVLCKNILIFNPVFGFSHMKFMSSIADILADKHNVTVFQPFHRALKNTDGLLKNKNVEIINYYPSHYDELVNQTTQTFPAFWESYFMNNPVFQTFRMPSALANDYKRTAVQLMKDQKIQEELRSPNYDVMIVEAFELSGFYIAHLIGIPSIPVISAVRSEPIGELFGQNSVLGFVAREGSRMAPDAGFFERLNDVYRDYLWKKTMNILGDLQYSNIQGSIDRPVPYWKDLVKQSPIFITNSNPYLDFAVPATPAIVNAGGITMDVNRKPEKLPEDYERILRERDSTILISFGSVIRSFQMPDHFKAGLIKMFESLPDVTFIWKYEKEDSELQRKLPKNVYLKQWVPQTAILSDDRLKLFITHGGLGSTMEIAYSGKPALMVPVFADQFQNAAMLSRHGGAVVYDKYDLQNGENLAGIVKEMIVNPKYKRNAERLLRVLSNQPVDVKQNLMKQVDFAIEFLEYRSQVPAISMTNFITYHYLDVVAFFGFSIILTSIFGVYAFVKFSRRLAKIAKVKHN